MVDNSAIGLGRSNRACAFPDYNRGADDPASTGRTVAISHANFGFEGRSNGQSERGHLHFRKQERQQSDGAVDRRTTIAPCRLRSKIIQMELRPLLLAVCLTLAISTASAEAAHVVWSGLVIAQNVPQPAPIPPELTKLEQTLKDLFGYNQFEVIGQSNKTLKTGEEDWLANSKYFGLHVDARGENDAGYTLNLKLYKENDVLLETDANLSKSSPLVIKGPQVGSGQLLLVLVVKDDELAHRRRHAEPANPITTAWQRLRRAIHNVLP